MIPRALAEATPHGPDRVRARHCTACTSRATSPRHSSNTRASSTRPIPAGSTFACTSRTAVRRTTSPELWARMPPPAGLTPPALEGRGAEIDAFDLLVARSHAGAPGRGMVLHGLRGVGKTVLLYAFARHANAHGWFIVPVEGRATKAGHLAARQKLVRSLGMAARRFASIAL